jgi:hypothetical protein
LLCLTPEGEAVLARIITKQKAWADAHGAAIGIEALDRARELVASIRPLVSMPASSDRD